MKTFLAFVGVGALAIVVIALVALAVSYAMCAAAVYC